MLTIQQIIRWKRNACCLYSIWRLALYVDKGIDSRWFRRADGAERADLGARNAAEVADTLSCDLVFGTGGLRGTLGDGSSHMNVLVVARATQGLANYLRKRFEAPSVVICRDSRHCSDGFARRTAEVLAGNGIRALLFPRVEPTPALSFAVRELGCSAGVVITASHNPKEYNGYKVYGADGCQITVAAAAEIQDEINAVGPSGVQAVAYEEGVESGLIGMIPDDVLDRYVEAVLAQSTGVDCSTLRVAYTPLNGTGLELVSRVLAGIGVADLHVVPEQAEPDGDFPTCPKPNPEEPAALELGIALGKRVGADVLLATDPDADRVGVAVPHDGEWKLLTGNELGLLLLDFLATRVREAGEDLRHRVAVTTIVSAPMADDLARAHGFELRRTLTGFKFCGEQIGILERQGRESDFLFGLEESYGYLAGTYVRDKDAVVACMLACELVAHWKSEGLDLWEAMQRLYDRYGHWGNEQVSVAYEGAEGPGRMAAIMDALRSEPPAELGGLAVESAIDYARGAAMPVVNPLPGSPDQALPPSNVLEFRLAGGSRVLVRPSGTEPKVKAYAFARGETAKGADALLGALVADLRGLLG